MVIQKMYNRENIDYFTVIIISVNDPAKFEWVMELPPLNFLNKIYTRYP